MRTATRLSGLAPSHRRMLLAGIATVILLAVVVPVGMTTLSGRWGDRTTSSGTAVGPAAARPGTSEEVAEAPTSPSPGTTNRGSAGSSKGTGPGAITTLVGTKIARSAWLGVEVKNLTAAGDQVRSITSTVGGQVISENVVTAPNPAGDRPKARPDNDKARSRDRSGRDRSGADVRQRSREQAGCGTR